MVYVKVCNEADPLELITMSERVTLEVHKHPVSLQGVN